jgi:hypothetical protein
MEKNDLYHQLLTMQKNNSKEKDWLVDIGYYVLSESGTPSPTNKANEFLEEFEKPLIEKIKEAFKESEALSKNDISELLNVDRNVLNLIILRMLSFHELIKENSDGNYLLNQHSD